jgi:hypothetical protein
MRRSLERDGQLTPIVAFADGDHLETLDGFKRLHAARARIDVTARFRADGWTPTDEWVVISMDLAGNPIGLTASGEVWISDHGAGAIAMISGTFEGFVLRQLAEYPNNPSPEAAST